LAKIGKDSTKDSTKWRINGAKELIQMIKDFHGFDHDAIYNITGFNVHQDANTKIFNIYCMYDPVVIRQTHDDYIRANRAAFDALNIINIRKYRMGHCSDMAFDTEYIDDIILALSL
jgi:hypothetical protein